MDTIVERVKELGLSFGQIILMGFLVVFAIFVLLAFLQYGFIYWIYAIVEDWVTVRLGFDYYFANLIATIFTCTLGLLVPTLAYYIFLGKRKAWGIGAIIGIQILITMGVYTIGNTVCFNRKTGEPLCYYVDTEKGRVWSYSPGYDPESGKAFHLYTKQIKEKETNLSKN